MKKKFCPECKSENLVEEQKGKYKCKKCGYFGSYVIEKFVYGE